MNTFNALRIVSIGISIGLCSGEIDWAERRPKICATDETYTCPTNEGNPLDVFVEVMILDLYDISEERMVCATKNVKWQFGMQIYFVLLWRDSLMNVSNLNIERPHTIPEFITKCLWMPDIIFYNCKETFLLQSTLPNSVFKLLPDGSIYHYARYQLVINCQMDFKLYPMDIQMCIFQIGFLYSRSKDAELRWMEETLDKKFPSIVVRARVKNQQFHVEKPIADKEVIVWQSGNSTELKCKLIFVRFITSSLLNTYIPSFLVVCLSFVSFWLDVNSVPGRVTLGVTSLLTLSTQIVSARSALPTVNYMTALDIWLFGCLLLVFLSLVEFTLANSLDRMQVLQNKVQPTVTLVKELKHGTNRLKNEKVKKNSWNYTSIDIDRISRYLFVTAMMVFTCVYWILFLSFTKTIT